jgi:streptogramin lyase
MIQLGIILVTAVVLSIASGTAHGKMVIQTFPVLAGAGPHDVYPAPDGADWFTAQSAGKLGRLDPRTGRSDLIPLGPDAAPPRSAGRYFASCGAGNVLTQSRREPAR